MRLKLVHPEVIIPDAHLCAEVAARGIENLIIEHLRSKNDSTKPNRYGLPKSNYYAQASREVSSMTNGKTAIVSIDHPGISMHYEGGTIYPKKKALAIPLDERVADIWPSEASGIGTGGMDDSPYALIWPKNANHGFIKDTENNDLLWLLIPKANISKDETVLPTADEILKAAEEAIGEALS